MVGEIVEVVGGVGVTQPQIELLAKRQITLPMLRHAASTCDPGAMKAYISALLDSEGEHDETAGPRRDDAVGNSC